MSISMMALARSLCVDLPLVVVLVTFQSASSVAQTPVAAIVPLVLILLLVVSDTPMVWIEFLMVLVPLHVMIPLTEQARLLWVVAPSLVASRLEPASLALLGWACELAGLVHYHFCSMMQKPHRPITRVINLIILDLVNEISLLCSRDILHLLFSQLRIPSREQGQPLRDDELAVLI